MDIDDRSARRVDDELDRLEAEYGSFDVHETRREVSRERYEHVRELVEKGTVGSAGVWLTNDDGEVLLVNDRDRDGWSEPAGTQVPGESLEETALRETREEAGVECDIEGVAVAQRLELVAANTSESPISRLVVAFDGRYGGGTPESDDDEIETVQWWSEHPDDLVFDGLADLDIPAAEE